MGRDPAIGGLSPTTVYSPRHLSNRALIGEITSNSSLLAKKEIELAKAEIRADLTSQLATVKALATTIPGWLAALIVGAVILVIGAASAYVGWRRMVTTPLALTRQTLKDDVQWVKERLAWIPRGGRPSSWAARSPWSGRSSARSWGSWTGGDTRPSTCRFSCVATPPAPR